MRTVQKKEIRADSLIEDVELKCVYNQIVIAQPFQLIKELSNEHKTLLLTEQIYRIEDIIINPL